MPKLTNEQLSAIHAAGKSGITKRDLFQSEVLRRKMDREGGVEIRGLGFVKTRPAKDVPFNEYVRMIRENEKLLERTLKSSRRNTPKIIADKMIMEEMLIRNPELKSEFLRQPRITEQELERMR